MSKPIVSAAIRIAAAGLGGAVGGPLGLALGAALGDVLGNALGAAASELLQSSAEKFGDEAARKLLEIGGDSLVDRLKPSAPTLNELCRKALLQSLDRIESYAPAGNSLRFKHWRKSLGSSGALSLDPIRPDQLTAGNLDSFLPRALSLLDAQGSGKPVPRELDSGLLYVIVTRLPAEFPLAFHALLSRDENAALRAQIEGDFRTTSTTLLCSIKHDTTQILEEIRSQREHTQSTPASRKPFNLPLGTIGDLFKGRESEMEALEKQLKKDGAAAIVQPKAITGMGGIGKTRLAIEYALHHQEDFSALLCVTANTPEELNTNLALLSRPEVLGLKEYESGNQSVQHAAVLKWFQGNKGWLLIVDNVDTKKAASAVQALVPALQHGQVLITSRIHEWGSAVRTLDLELLSEGASISYLVKKTAEGRQQQPRDEVEARAIAQELGRLALALEQAAAYVNARAISLAGYRARWLQNSDKLIDFSDDQASLYPKPIAVSLQTSFEQLSANGRRLLNILSWLAPEPVPKLLLNVGGGPFAAEAEDRLPKEKWPAAAEEAEEALANLGRFSLVSLSEGKTSFSVHRLVQAVARRGQQEEEQQKCIAAALRWVNSGFPFESNDVRFWPIAEQLAPHALAIAGEADHREIDEPTARLMNQLGLFYQSRAEWPQAELLYRGALEIDEKSYGPDHPDVAVRLNNLAGLLRATNRMAESEPLYRRALAIDEKSYGPNHPEVATDLSNLAGLLRATNRVSEAEPLYRRALAIDEESYGPEHPEVARDLNNLAELLRGTNRLDEAEPLIRRALEIDEKSYGPNHPNVAIRLNNLARLFQDTNRLSEAEPLMRRALAIDEKSYGPHHPAVARDLNNLAELLRGTNRLDEAEPLIRRALEIDEKNYGPDHPDVAIRLNNLALLLQATNRLDEAEPLSRRAVAILVASTRATGHRHPNLETAIGNYRAILKDKGMTEEQILTRLREMAPEFLK